MALPEKYVITVGRSLGAGGRVTGHRLAEALGIDYYDKELLASAAESVGMDKRLFEKNDERAPGFLAGLLPMSMGYNALAWYAGPNNVSGEAVYGAQCDFIRRAADKGPCVIVGRTADYVLRDNPNVVSVFLHADEDACVDRIVRREECCTPQAARALIRKTNRLRAEFYNFYTDRTWGAAATYDLTINSARIGLEDRVRLIIDFINCRFGSQHK